MPTVDVIIYHGRQPRCSDGVAAAAILLQAFPAAQLVPANHSDSFPPETYRHQHVVMVDFALPRGQLEALADATASVVVLDHHKSAQHALQGLQHPHLQLILDLTRSGAQLAWDWVHPNTPRPWPVEMVADRDLWTWKFLWSQAAGKATYAQGYHDSPQLFLELLTSEAGRNPNGYKEFLLSGLALMQAEERQIKEQLKVVPRARLVCGDRTYTVGVLSAPYEIRSELGQALCDQYRDLDFAVLYQYDVVADTMSLSLRSSEQRSDIDLSVIATFFPGGGGHPQSAGATLYGPQATVPDTLPAHIRGLDFRHYFQLL